MASPNEFEHLRQAEADLAKASVRIERQIELIERMAASGQDTTTAKTILATMQTTFAVMEAHRSAILKELGRQATALMPEPPGAGSRREKRRS
jgi:multidrug resistance efflux pump